MGTQNSINVGEELSESVVIYNNLAPKVVVIDLAQMNILIRDHDDAVKKSTEWIGVLAFVVSLILANITSEFKDFAGLSSDTWRAIFVLGLVVALIWFIVVLLHCLTNRKRRSVDYFIKQFTEKATVLKQEGNTAE